MSVDVAPSVGTGVPPGQVWPPPSIVHSVTSAPPAHCEYVEHVASPCWYVCAGVPVQPSRSAQPVNVAGTDGKPSAVLPFHGTSGSSVPWNSITGTGRLG